MVIQGNVMKRLCDEIREDSRCLWESITRFIAGEYTDWDCASVHSCYSRLKINYALYYEQRHAFMSQQDEWFTQVVLEAFEDLYARQVIKTN